ncbi:MAG TPA: hypothetical protein VFA34_05815 [Actinomycetota bacterium]|jgi:hypothetical protein|nr:hypothetical protein [Actinomycetota bacterium]
MSLRHAEHLASIQRRTDAPKPAVGHAHFWERAMSRRSLFGVAAGALAAGTVLKPGAAWAGSSDPKPIPGGLGGGGQGYHVYLPGEGAEPSTIFDFNGIVAIQQVGGTGMGRQGGVVAPFPFEVDVRFMAGKYIAEDGKLRRGTFAFI